ncbi:MAG: NADPH-dependent 7-cyano-7-deazaguanine reductase QueF [Gammaproteobacteria bacterium]|nr:NADPH-dependent 7-cyano-7-deazaguanine reductase QueF [Gammaproteobacteria bacterium]
MDKNPLGEKPNFPDKYDPDILYPIPRWPSRSLLDIDKKVPLHGFDFWRAYELSWLNAVGKPEVGVGELFFDARSENLVESKSLKLYLNSLNNERFASSQEFAARIASDLTGVTRSEVEVIVKSCTDESLLTLDKPPGTCLDQHEVEISTYLPDASLLQSGEQELNSVSLFSDLFRSNCPITGQPDWATFMIEYSGVEIDENSLLAYICSFRQHQGYHEECVELIFRDIMMHCHPTDLIVGLNYTRRGGLDINSFRSNNHISPDQLSFRLARQ